MAMARARARVRVRARARVRVAARHGLLRRHTLHVPRVRVGARVRARVRVRVKNRVRVRSRMGWLCTCRRLKRYAAFLRRTLTSSW